VWAVARVAFQRDDLLCNELPRAVTQGRNVGWNVKVHGRKVFRKIVNKTVIQGLEGLA
jgi:hypothetical protein